MVVHRASSGLLTIDDPGRLRVLFMAPYAPDGPGYEQKAYTADGGYPEYHYRVFERLRRLGFRMESSSKPYAIVHAGGAVDYVFSLFNRMAVRNSEVFVSAYCEYLGLRYLGAPPNVRAIAEDKYISKLVAETAGIPIPRGVPYHRGITPRDAAPFPGPYFIKDRFGAASEGLTIENMQPDWKGARAAIEAVWDSGTDALLEEFVDGIDITVPVMGDDAPRILGVYEPRSDKPGHILTHDLKLNDVLGYRERDLHEPWLLADVTRLWDAVGPIDYFRLDYRFDPATGRRRFLEFNICCYIGEHGPFGYGAARHGISTDELLEHIVAYSLLRQHWGGHDRKRIL